MLIYISIINIYNYYKFIFFFGKKNLIYYGSNKKSNTLAISLDNGESWDNIKELGDDHIMDIIQDSIDDSVIIDNNFIYYYWNL